MLSPIDMPVLLDATRAAPRLVVGFNPGTDLAHVAIALQGNGGARWVGLRAKTGLAPQTAAHVRHPGARQHPDSRLRRSCHATAVTGEPVAGFCSMSSAWRGHATGVRQHEFGAFHAVIHCAMPCQWVSSGAQRTRPASCKPSCVLAANTLPLDLEPWREDFRVHRDFRVERGRGEATQCRNLVDIHGR